MGRGPLKSSWRAVLAMAMSLAVCPAFAAEPDAVKPTAVETIHLLHSAFLDVMKRASELGFDGRLNELTGTVEDSFDLEFMALKTIGEGRKGLGESERARWIASFKGFLLSNYARRFDGWSGQSFENVSEDPAPRNTVVVRTRLLRPNKEDVKLDYRLRPTASGWRIIDIYSNGNVSELALRRSEFSKLFKQVGLDQLIASVDEKAARR